MVEATTLEDVKLELESSFDDRIAVLNEQGKWSESQQSQLDAILGAICSEWYCVVVHAQYGEPETSQNSDGLPSEWNDYRLAAGADNIVFSSWLQRPVHCDVIYIDFFETLVVKHAEKILEAITSGVLPTDPVELAGCVAVTTIIGAILGAVVVFYRVYSTKPIKDPIHNAVYRIALDHCKNNTGDKEACSVEQITEWLTKLANINTRDDESLRHFGSETRNSAKEALKVIRDRQQWAVEACQEAVESLHKMKYLQPIDCNEVSYYRVVY